MSRAGQRRGRLRAWLLGATSILVLAGGALFAIGCALSGPHYQGPVSDHFDGRRFHNLAPLAHRSPADLLRWWWTRKPGPWREWTDAEPGPPPPQRVAGGRLRVTFVNHATVLLQMDGLNILTDPIWSERASPVAWAGPRRVRPPGIRFADLPPIDAVIVSHNHYDHLDLPSLKRLQQAHDPLFVVGLGNAALLRAAGIDKVRELDWWQSLALSASVRLSATPAQHFSARGLCDRDATLWAGYVLQGPAGAVYFAGDTGDGPHFEQIAQRFGPLRLALLPIGAYRPAWIMARVHLSPRAAVAAQRRLHAATAMGIHFGTFRLADDGQDKPLEALSAALAERGAGAPFWVLDFGEGREVPASDNY